MQQLNTLIPDAPTRTFSQSRPSSIATIPAEVHAALFTIINKSRKLNGWLARSAKELNPTIMVWAETFGHYNIPVTAYDRIYRQAFDVRQRAIANGKEPPPMDATLLVACWDGEHGVRAQLRQEEIERGRTLGSNAASVCRHCYGSGFRQLTDRKGVTRCDHEDQ